MCAWVRCCGGSAKKSTNIYKDGVLETGLYNKPWKPSYAGAGTLLSVGSITNNGTTLTLASTGSNNASTSFISEEFDFTNLNTVRLDVAGYSHPYWDVGVIAGNDYQNNYTPLVKINAPQVGITDIDVSGITGTGRVFIFAGGGNGMNIIFNSITCQA